MQQASQTVLMVRPNFFAYNAQTATSNAFQNQLKSLSADDLRGKALQEFDAFVATLRAKQIEVVVVEDEAEPKTPDAVFPNNWVMFHHTGAVSLFPMKAPNRRLERRMDILENLKSTFTLTQIKDLSHTEKDNLFLEGTGSMVFDHAHKIGYACISPRTDRKLFEQFCTANGYTPVTFTAVDENQQAIYHTNVMMCVGSKIAVVCLESIAQAEERKKVEITLKNNGLEVVEISFAQMNKFAGNMLEVQNKQGHHFLVMSNQAYKALTTNQVATIEKYCEIIHPSIYIIEAVGGGSARCMMAEVFLPRK